MNDAQLVAECRKVARAAFSDPNLYYRRHWIAGSIDELLDSVATHMADFIEKRAAQIEKINSLVQRIQHEYRAEPTSQYVLNGIACVHSQDCLYCAFMAILDTEPSAEPRARVAEQSVRCLNRPCCLAKGHVGPCSTSPQASVSPKPGPDEQQVAPSCRCGYDGPDHSAPQPLAAAPALYVIRQRMALIVQEELRKFNCMKLDSYDFIDEALRVAIAKELAPYYSQRAASEAGQAPIRTYTTDQGLTVELEKCMKDAMCVGPSGHVPPCVHAGQALDGELEG
jgi:hypothetical protein